MPTLFQLAQLGFALFLAIAIGERVRALFLRAAVSDEGFRWLLRAVQSGDLEAARCWAQERPSAQLARMIAVASASTDGSGDLRELAIDLREEASVRLRLIRVSATLASTMGLLGGIVTIARGSSVEGAGLAALQAGGAERLTMNQAIATMAIGIATSALCFQALALLKPAATKLLTQLKQVERALEAGQET